MPTNLRTETPREAMVMVRYKQLIRRSIWWLRGVVERPRLLPTKWLQRRWFSLLVRHVAPPAPAGGRLASGPADVILVSSRNGPCWWTRAGQLRVIQARAAHSHPNPANDSPQHPLQSTKCVLGRQEVQARGCFFTSTSSGQQTLQNHTKEWTPR